MQRILITGGSGFIGTNLIQSLLKNKCIVLNIDKLDHTSKFTNLFHPSNDKNNYIFKKLDILETKKLSSLINNFKPNLIFHLAAESHVDNSINNPKVFIESNIVGTFSLLESVRGYLSKNNLKNFRLINISTDEVYGSIVGKKKAFENSFYNPSSPYSASKASSVHLCNAWVKTFDLPIINTFSANNFGPYQSPEKLIPKIIINAINKNDLEIYGDGKNIRNWIFVKDNAEKLISISKRGTLGENYNIGTNIYKNNLEIVTDICNILNLIQKDKFNYNTLIKFVKDRPGHDLRYAINTEKYELIFKKKVYDFQKSLKQTILWYKNNYRWYQKLLNNNILSRKGLI